jgi:hypothetical protein
MATGGATLLGEFMPGLAFGDGLGGEGGKEGWVRKNADAAEVETVGVEADGEGGFGLGRAAVVDPASSDEEVHPKIIKLEVAGLAKSESELCTARAVLWVAEFIFPAGVMEKREKANDFLIGGVMAGEVEAIAADS